MGASDDAGEYFEMSLAASMLAGNLPGGSIIVLKLVEPLDFTYVAASKHMFVRIHIRLQPRMTYGQCVAYTDGTVERLVPVGATVKFPSSTNYLIARPELVGLLSNSIDSEVRLPSVNNSSAKRVCTRPLEFGGEQAIEPEAKPKGTSNIIEDLEGVLRPTRNKSDLQQREKDLYFVFREMDVGKWDYSITTDWVL